MSACRTIAKIVFTTLFVVAAAPAYAGGSIKDAPHYRGSPWAGFYAGVHGAYTDAGAAGSFDNAGLTPHANFGSFDLTDWGVGGQIGYNYLAGAILIGIEADATATRVGDSFVDGENDRQSLKLSTMASVRGRLGYTFSNLLVYGTAGVGFIRGRLDVENGTDGLNVEDSGFVYGGGLEWMLAPKLTLKAEYLRFDFDKGYGLNGLLDGDPPDSLRLDAVDTIRVGLNFMLN